MSAFDDLKDIAPLQIWPALIGRALTGAEATLGARSSSSRTSTCPSTRTSTSRSGSSSAAR